MDWRQVVEHLLCKCKVLSSNSSSTKKQNKNKINTFIIGHFFLIVLGFELRAFCC
jgi:hypothetical protein